MNRLGKGAAILGVGLCIATLAGCAPAAPRTHSAGFLAWDSRMTSLFDDPNGNGGGGGGLQQTDGRKTGYGEVILGSVAPGKYDVLAVCTGTSIVHFSIAKGQSKRDVLASADITCGATLRLPVTITSPQITLKASDADANAEAFWNASIVSPGWEPSPTIYG